MFGLPITSSGSIKLSILVSLVILASVFIILASQATKNQPIELAYQQVQFDFNDDIGNDGIIIQNGSGSQYALEHSFEHYEIAKGDNLFDILQRYNIPVKTIHNIATSEYGKVLNRLNVGDEISILMQFERLEQFVYKPSKLEAYHFIASQNGFNSVHRKYELETYVQLKSFVIEDSLFESGMDAGLSQSMIAELANIYAWDIDFAVDLRRGDRFSLAYEALMHQGEKIGEGKILAAEFINNGKQYEAILFKESGGNQRYFDVDGNSMRRAFLRNPLDIFRISSRFNPKRKHPILNRIRAHTGTDYAAPRGTAVKATGQGVVSFVGRDGGYGNMIKIKHGGNSETRYAHLLKFKKGIRKGKKVKQGEVIGYVGKSGLATGYHLHYEYRKNGIARNSMRVKFPKSSPVNKKDKQRFQQTREQMLGILDNVTQYYAQQ